ncbi:PA3496 family putative envelope integrity protein [Atopomonas sediminilitoris]|uniref:PA3496 family putative envelope integrity protein n=1 Tax=Atopomonas sediminilitoris TaxID=2919919 RepID=UPI001F4D7353|nr:hypothetical protein [Atopomonas sediminilitoris]MCJ8168154.1 hypothetical protein [Atopomonas sediminilitoris]
MHGRIEQHLAGNSIDVQNMDAKTRRKLADKRRMAFRRAIERHSEEQRLQRETYDFYWDEPGVSRH